MYKSLQKKKLTYSEYLSLNLPSTNKEYDSATIWVDQFSRRVQFIPMKTTATAEDFVKTFVNEIFFFFGFPDEIISDRDPYFTSEFQ